MKLIVGLGNPGKTYENTRHNIGFMVINKLAAKLKINFSENKKLLSSITKSICHGDKFILAKPMKFMNLSGNSILKIVNYYKINPKGVPLGENQNICIISDDVDLPIGIIRIRGEGSPGGHKGLESIIKSLNTDKFFRIRIGIARLHGLPQDAEKLDAINTKKFVLENFTKPEQKIIEKVILKTSSILLEYLNGKKLTSHTYRS